VGSLPDRQPWPRNLPEAINKISRGRSPGTPGVRQKNKAQQLAATEPWRKTIHPFVRFSALLCDYNKHCFVGKLSIVESLPKYASGGVVLWVVGASCQTH